MTKVAAIPSVAIASREKVTATILGLPLPEGARNRVDYKQPDVVSVDKPLYQRPK